MYKTKHKNNQDLQKQNKNETKVKSFHDWRWLSSGLLRRVVWYQFADISVVLAAAIIALMTIRHNNPEHSHLHTRRQDNLKSNQFPWLSLLSSRILRQRITICATAVNNGSSVNENIHIFITLSQQTSNFITSEQPIFRKTRRTVVFATQD
jgi:hypothetical protein